ncbi:MAG: GyrI-like domain-containing protein [Fusicatenibacter sp.]
MPESLQKVNTEIFSEWLPGNSDYEIAGMYNIEYYTALDDYPIFSEIDIHRSTHVGMIIPLAVCTCRDRYYCRGQETERNDSCMLVVCFLHIHTSFRFFLPWTAFRKRAMQFSPKAKGKYQLMLPSGMTLNMD